MVEIGIERKWNSQAMKKRKEKLLHVDLLILDHPNGFSRENVVQVGPVLPFDDTQLSTSIVCKANKVTTRQRRGVVVAWRPP